MLRLKAIVVRRLPRPALFLTCALLLRGAAAAQSDPLLCCAPTITGFISPVGVALADFNEDGRQDAAVADAGTGFLGWDQVLVMLGQGNGAFTQSSGMTGGVGTVRSVATADFNGDGHADVAASHFNEFPSSPSITMSFGQGDGTFVQGPSTMLSAGPLVAGDFNADGRQDLVSVGGLGILVLIGDGQGTFAFHTFAAAQPGISAIAVGDLDADGKPDIVTSAPSSSNPGFVSVYLGEGHGTFHLGSVTTVDAKPVSVVLGDFDKDGKQDVAVACSSVITVSVLPGLGDGTFAPRTTWSISKLPSAMVAGDWNGDGATDLACASSASGVVRVLVAQAGGGFALGPVINAGTKPIFITSGLLDGDTASDLIVASEEGGTLFQLLGKGDGTFRTSSTFASGGTSITVTAGEFNGDGKPDLAVARPIVNESGDAIDTWLGQGDGTFVKTASLPVTGDPWTVTVGDFNGDGVQDLAQLTGGDVTILQGLGNGSFVKHGSAIPMTFQPRVAALGDFNGDDRQDIAVAGSDSFAILLGDGTGGFANAGTTTIPGSGAAWGLVTADFDEDGLPDLVTSRTAVATFWHGLGDGTFVNQGTSPFTGDSMDLEHGDFNGDGHEDYAVASWFFLGYVQIRLGLGDGTFSEGQSLDVPRNARALVVRDLDGDGNQDLAVACELDGVIDVWHGQGDGTFVHHATFLGDTGNLTLTAADFDLDGRPDLATASQTEKAITVLLNDGAGPWLDSGYALPGAGGVPGLSGSGTLQAGSSGALILGHAKPAALGNLFLSLASMPSPFKGGTLATVPIASSIPLVTSPLGAIALPWAAWPAGLAGLSLHFQYAILDSGAAQGIALSNALQADVP